MLEFTSKPKALDFKIDGKVKHLPLSLGVDEFAEMGKAIEDIDDDSSAYLKWFKDYVGKIVGKDAEKFGDVELTALMGEWNDAREKIGEANAGEA